MTAAKSETATPITSARKSRATRAAGKAAAQTTKPTTTPAPAAKPTEAPQPQAKIDLGARQNTVYVPVVTMPDGTERRCEHSKYGHESTKSAQACARRMIKTA